MLRFEADANLTYASSSIVIEHLNVLDGPNEQVTADKVVLWRSRTGVPGTKAVLPAAQVPCVAGSQAALQ